MRRPTRAEKRAATQKLEHSVLEKGPSKNNLKKHTEKTIENKPVLASERKARLKEEKRKNIARALSNNNPSTT